MRTTRQGAPRYRFGAFVLHVDRLTLDGRTVPLASKPFAVLRALVERAGELVSKETLANAGWGARPVSDESLSRTVFLLRQALGDNDTDRPRYVETVYGRGYRFVGDVDADMRAPGPVPAPEDPREREARELCLLARSQLSRGMHRVREAFTLFERAVACCPTYVPALAGLGEIHLYSASGGLVAPRVAIERAQLFLEDAVRLAPDDGRARACLGVLHGAYLHDVGRADAEIARALASDPAEPLAHWARGMHWLSLGRFDGACDALDTAAALDPTNVTVLLHRGVARYMAGDVDGALTRVRELARFEPRVVAAGMTHAMLAAAAGRHDEAVAVAEKHLETPDAHPQLRPIVAYALALAGRREAAAALLAEIERRIADGAFVMPTFVAALALELGDRTRALRALDEAVEAPCPWGAFAAVMPPFASLRGDPAFRAVCARLGRGDVGIARG